MTFDAHSNKANAQSHCCCWLWSVDNIWAVVTVCRARVNIIRTVLWSRTLLHVLLSKLPNPVTSLLSFSLCIEHIDYKLLSLTYKVLTTNQPSYLHNLITVQPPHSNCSSSLHVLLALPSTSSSTSECMFCAVLCMTHVSTTWMKNILVTLLDVGIHEARDLAQNLQTDVFAQRYALVVVHAAIGLDCSVLYCVWQLCTQIWAV